MTELRIGSLGRVDAGKSSTISVMTYSELDDGKGSARKKILQFPHEQETGRTSSVNRGYLQLKENKHIVFIDLAGHQKYLKTTMFGISGYNINYAMVVVGANMGLCQITKEHVNVVLSLRIPIFFVITKVDLAPPDIYQNTIDEIIELMRKYRNYYTEGGVMITEENRHITDEVLTIYHDKDVRRFPIFSISNKTGQCIDVLRYFLSNLPERSNKSRIDANSDKDLIAEGSAGEGVDQSLFRVNDIYMVKGVGMILSGFMYKGTIKKGMVLHLGPIFNGKWVRVLVKSIHGNFRNELNELPEHQSGCLAIRNLDEKKIKFARSDIRKGVVCSNKELALTRRFRALILVVQGHSTTIKNKYQPVINCKTVVQNAQISEIEKEIIRSGDSAKATFRFMFRPEYLAVGDVFVFREGNLRGMGRILERLDDVIIEN